jgi:Arc/MetJ-type ribon-helix-helix transcriptional regulator
MSDKKGKPQSGVTQTSIKERILGELYSEQFELKKREVHVMTRLSSDIVEILDALVELEVFKSRSEAVSAYVEKGIAAQMDLYEDVRGLGRKISEMRETAKRMAVEAFSDMK